MAAKGIKYPTTLSEEETIQAALAGRSLARIGDGELRLCLGGKHIAQETRQELADELRMVMLEGKSLVCIPNHASANGKPVMWGPTRYGGSEYVALYDHERVYGSSFVCRPDSAPWIDTDEYWLLCRKLWEGQDVTLVIGTRGGSLTSLNHARSVRLIYGPERDAYREVDRLEAEIAATPERRALICLGPCATVLAERLCRRGMHALDLGHLGRFMPQRFQQP